MPILSPPSIYLSLLLVARPFVINAHSWIEKLQSPYGAGQSRIGMLTKSDSYLIRYFCPYENIDDCQPDPKHGIDLYDLPASNGDPRRPCRSGMVSEPKTPATPGSDILISWAGNGHVANGQSYGTCVTVMLGSFKDDPSLDEFVELPGAECLDFWIVNNDGRVSSEGTITIPNDTAPGQYTLFWSWNFTEFWYSSCADIVVSDGEGTFVPTKSPVMERPDQDVIDDYLQNGCSDLQDSDDFCRRYSGLGDISFCDEDFKDSCGRSSCDGLDRSMLIPCPECPPAPGPPGCPAPKPFYDDFSDGFDSTKWLKAHKTWGGGKDGFTNGGVVEENIYFDESAGKVILKAHGSLYTGDVMGVEKGANGKIVRMNTGVRVGAAIATRDYFGAGSYEVRMKVAEDLGVCSAIWTFYYSDKDYYYGVPIVNHEIDIEVPGRPGASHNNIDFDKTLMNTWVGEIDSLYTVNYTALDSHINDGNFHTWRFDWHTDESNRKVEFYVDDKLYTTNYEHVPFYAGRLWLGAWFPNKWAGDPNFDVSQMEIDYVRFTPFLDENYECPPETYPHYGWAPGTDFTHSPGSPEAAPTRCSNPSTSSPTSAPIPVPAPSPAPVNTGNTAVDDAMYLEKGCTAVHSNYCANAISAGSYCKYWSQDDCGRSVCQGHSHAMLILPCPSPTTPAPPTPSPTPAPTVLPTAPPTPSPTPVPTLLPITPPTPSPTSTPPSDDDIYKADGCGNLASSFCSGYMGTYCKNWQSDHCGRSVCKGDAHSNLDSC